MAEMLRVEDVEKYYGNKSNLTKAIDKISLSVDKGEFAAIMGPSGSGKTTLLNMIATIDKVTAGHIYLSGTDITKIRGEAMNRFRREMLGFIFQDFNLLDTLTVYENIALALQIQKVKPEEIDRRVVEAAHLMNLEQILNKYPYQISGGEKQRTASARAVITRPKLILADEPTGALDSKNAKNLMEHLLELNKKREATILMVTHDAFTASYADRVIFIKDGRLYSEIRKGEKGRKAFFDKIIDMMSLLGGDFNDVI
ncbi:ABC transporter ATP-binding protein [Coprococcus sp. AF21-14LB]|uniref:ABC transporter ATP-binding protein n=1 Tax=Coprococcus sp. AF21-14LB TaxID=2292231 RepID=UPI000E4ED318|nr:ABC transporter ATP-binding protein [Coprococcus sp. AF21-14LB]RGS81680.1 ABC transporter ATP-binding protein [Coprococcus sp. AF21-14LB]